MLGNEIDDGIGNHLCRPEISREFCKKVLLLLLRLLFF